VGKADVERKLKRAVSHAVPDVKEEILRRVETENDRVVPLNLRKRPRKRSLWEKCMPYVTAAAVLLLAINIGVTMHQQNRAQRVETVIDLDVNPSVELCINAEDRVVSATGINSDAQRILEGMDLTGARTNVAINAVLGAMYAHGYIDENSNSILISVDGGDEEKSRELQGKLVEDIDALMQGYSVEASIISQTVTIDEGMQDWVDTYEISAGRGALIQKIIEMNPRYTVDDLALLTINELNLLISAQSVSVNDVQTTGQASEAAYIGQEEALRIALENAELSAEDVELLETNIDILNARMVYGVDFVLEGMQHSYEIDALTGDIVLQNISEYVPEENETETENEGENSPEEEGSVSENAVSDNESQTPSVSGNSVSGNSISGNSVSGNSVSGNSVSGNSVSGNSVSGNSVSRNSVSRNSISRNSVSRNQVSVTERPGDAGNENIENN